MDYSLNSQNFEAEVLKSNIPVLVDFSADWCGPCKMMAPVIDELAAEYEGEMKVGKINVDQSPDIAQKYNVMSIPMFAFFKNGEVIETAVGALNKSKLQGMIDKVLA
ncbi:thioredoxin [Butyrivibrio sp. YAB3001]|uniref:thioredoxin n=1 Tax=Butyrivibrio sp. YAB3001 TaxID=1520812 RepID=UPI0008F68C06|nr:thioredoxin [Butyrivibrio sp. YAB3001]SFC88448.1 thioredoxin [Butyrivibrio sp. YAB3001]